uniref:Putative secreted protein n=1 Tax=Xenopsylla cheopis TaxID=163159 RepID=A0A6M2DYX8_XENCH
MMIFKMRLIDFNLICEVPGAFQKQILITYYVTHTQDNYWYQRAFQMTHWKQLPSLGAHVEFQQLYGGIVAMGQL